MEKIDTIPEIPLLDKAKVVPEVLNSQIFKSDQANIKDWASFRDPKRTELRDNLFLAELKSEKNLYTGLVNYDMKRDHVGIHKYENGDIYLGEWKDNKRHGHGIYLHYKPKEKNIIMIEMFLGKWAEDKPANEGVYCWIEEKEKNYDFMKSGFHAFVGELNEDSFKRGIYLSKTGEEKFYIYYGAFKDGLKNDEQCYFYDNDFTIDRVFRGRITDDVVQEGFFVSFHQDDIDDTVYLKFNKGEPSEVALRSTMEKDTVKKIDEECLHFREILYEEDWFNLIYEKTKEAYKIINNAKLDDFNNEKKFKEIVKIAGCYKEIPIYANLCKNMFK